MLKLKTQLTLPAAGLSGFEPPMSDEKQCPTSSGEKQSRRWSSSMRVSRFYVAGIATTVFGRHLERSLHDLAGEALQGALKDAGCRVEEAAVQFISSANSAVPETQVARFTALRQAAAASGIEQAE